MYIISFLYICSMKAYILLLLTAFYFQSVTADNIAYKWEPIDKEFDALALQCEEVAFVDQGRSDLYQQIKTMYRIAGERQNRQLQARAYYWEAWIQAVNDLDSAALLVDKAIALTDTVRYEYDYAHMQLVEMSLLRNRGKWLQAYMLGQKLEPVWKKYDDLFYLGKTYVQIGVTLRELQEYEMALSYLKKAENAFKEVASTHCEIKNRINISNTLYNLGREAEALEILKALVENPVARQDTSYLINVMVSLFSVSDMQEKQYAREAYRLARESDSQLLIDITSISMGALMLKDNKNDSALTYYYQAYWDIMGSNNNATDMFPILYGMSEAYSRLNRSDSAYHYLKELEVYRDSFLAYDKIMQVNRMESRITIEKYQSEIMQAKENAVLQKRITVISVMALTLLLFLITYILLLSRKKEKMKKQLKETENWELMLQNNQYEIELNLKNRELTSNTLIITEKNQSLKGLIHEIEILGKEGKIPAKDESVLKKKIKEHLDQRDEWQYFKIHFENVNPNFFTKLKETFPSLSENDLRFCAYIRIGMSTKEIAQILSVLPDTVITTRYRLRKKMELGQDSSLEDFLRTF